MTIITETEREMRRAAVAANPFGAWLLGQRHRDDYIGTLAKAACTDPRFPRRGTGREVWNRVTGQAFDQDTLTALQDALTEWRGEIAAAVKVSDARGLAKKCPANWGVPRGTRFRDQAREAQIRAARTASR